MKAIILEKTGPAENLKMDEIEKPAPLENQVLIEVKSLSINPVDFKVRSNENGLNRIYGEKRPAIIGWDIAGTVVGLGEKANRFKIGDRVFGMVNFPGAGNGYAEFVTASEDHLTKIPDGTSFNEAAATTLAALTALQILEKRVKKGDKVLIHAGSGGVGHFAIQIAKSLGAYVITTSSAKNKDLVLSLGADQHIDYQKQAFEEIVNEVDLVFDMLNGDILLNSIKVTKKGGTVVSIPSSAFSEESKELAKERGVLLDFLMVKSNGDDMHKLKEMLESGALKPHISKKFSFSDMAEAHKHLESGRTVGKVVVEL